MRFGPFWRRVTELAEHGTLPDWMTDRQARARATRERVLTAMAHLLERHAFEQITMQTIAAEAGISIGALYARFPSKDAVLGQLGLVVFEDVRDRFARALEGVPHAAGLRGVVGTYVDTLVAELRRFRSVILALRASAGARSAVGSLLLEANHAIHETFLTRARRHEAEICQRNTSAALQWALFTTNAAAREAILTDALAHYRIPGGRRALRHHLTKSTLAYLLST